MMLEATVEVLNPSGLHARPAAAFVKAACGFASSITVSNLTRDAGRSASAKSILGVLALGVSRGHRVRLVADGPDADEALAAMTRLIEAGIGERPEQ